MQLVVKLIIVVVIIIILVTVLYLVHRARKKKDEDIPYMDKPKEYCRKIRLYSTLKSLQIGLYFYSKSNMITNMFFVYKSISGNVLENTA